ncbi:SAF domain-containing protein [Aeromicrobium sp. REDSEA-S32_B7]|jgi:Flp pilus assembly protein CpaB|uniref:SAF domain-containing protein n=2 Tax=unclassified Aeromicrobium TaxID=2633570 RepID=UPI000B1979E8|nr:SAF domain-containing protein [Aeromicrobium sp. REDSEA-S32_B7]
MDRLRSSLLEHRRLLAALCTALAVLLALTSVRRPPDQVEVAVAARDLASGTVLSADDVTSSLLPAGAAPQHLLSSDDLEGRRVGGPMRRGEAFTDVRLLAAGPVDGLPPGHVVTAVRLADATSGQAVRVGDRVEVLAVATGAGGPRASVAASGAVVAAVPDLEDPDAPVLWLTVPRRTALELARVGVEAQLSVVVEAGDD